MSLILTSRCSFTALSIFSHTRKEFKLCGLLIKLTGKYLNLLFCVMKTNLLAKANILLCIKNGEYIVGCVS